MLDLPPPGSFNTPLASVVEEALKATTRLNPDRIMVVGAECRDILHRALGHTFRTAATRDVDLALALSSWSAYQDLAASFPRVGGTGISFRIADALVDLLPFGGIEDPQGVVSPPSRGEALSVWAFEEIYADSLPFALNSRLSIRIPTAAGYAAAKLGAWLDRSQHHEAKDAADLALVMHWYAESAAVQNRLYDTETGVDILLAEGTDVPRAAARLLGADVVATIGSTRRAELLARWPGNVGLLTSELRLRGGAPAWPAPGRRSELVEALTRGLSA